VDEWIGEGGRSLCAGGGGIWKEETLGGERGKKVLERKGNFRDVQLPGSEAKVLKKKGKLRKKGSPEREAL